MFTDAVCDPLTVEMAEESFARMIARMESPAELFVSAADAVRLEHVRELEDRYNHWRDAPEFVEVDGVKYQKYVPRDESPRRPKSGKIKLISARVVIHKLDAYRTKLRGCQRDSTLVCRVRGKR